MVGFQKTGSCIEPLCMIGMAIKIIAGNANTISFSVSCIMRSQECGGMSLRRLTTFDEKPPYIIHIHPMIGGVCFLLESKSLINCA